MVDVAASGKQSWDCEAAEGRVGQSQRCYRLNRKDLGNRQQNGTKLGW